MILFKFAIWVSAATMAMVLFVSQQSEGLISQCTYRPGRCAFRKGRVANVENEWYRRASKLSMGRKIDAEVKAMGDGKRKRGKKDKKEKRASTADESIEELVVVENDVANKGATYTVSSPNIEVGDKDGGNSYSRSDAIGEGAQSQIARETPAGLGTDAGPVRVPRSDPLRQNKVPPEVFFFGEPRKPPPIEAAQETGYHGTLLMWARHATVAPRTAMERLETVFPRGRRHSKASLYRLDCTSLDFDSILKAFVGVSDDLEASKDFIISNMDLVPPQLFLRTITGAKLEAQQARNMEEWAHLREMRRRYILAHDQVFFPLNIEVQKAETRVMTYLARSEIKNFARVWDEVEMTLHMTTLLAARLTWDERCRDVLRGVREKVDKTVGYMSAGIERQLMSREFRKPGLTSEVYTNASRLITEEIPELYAKVYPEVKLVNEAFYMSDTVQVRIFVEKEFCPRYNISLDQLKERLRLFETCLSSIQGVNYVNLRLVTRTLLEMLSSEDELQALDRWHLQRRGDSWAFDTYEPDDIPTMVCIEQRMRDTGSAFKDFAVQVLKMPTYYTDAFSGKRPKASTVGDWFFDDDEVMTPEPSSFEERIDEFRKAYIEQSQLRQDAESKLADMIENKMDAQDKAVRQLSEPSKVIEFGDK